MKRRRRTCVIDGRLRVESRILRFWFDDFNKEFFNSKLPRSTFLFWHPDLLGRAYGQFFTVEDTGSGFPAIAIADYLRTGNIFGGTLLHEMIHVKHGPGHRRKFKRERARLLRIKDVLDMVI